MKNLPDGINRLEIAEEKVDECEGTAIETIQSETQMNNVSVTLGTK